MTYQEIQDRLAEISRQTVAAYQAWIDLDDYVQADHKLAEMRHNLASELATDTPTA